ncbi:MAG: ferrochelatase [Acidobacteriota bacterium]
MGGASQAAVDSVLLIGFGGPTRPEEILPFLRRVVAGRGIPDERLREVERHYLAVGGRSPYNDLAGAQRDALQGWLEDAGLRLPVFMGMRNWNPLLEDTVQEMNARGCHHAVGIILAAHRSEASLDRYLGDVDRAVESNSHVAPRITMLDAWFDHPRFLEAAAARAEEGTGFRRGGWPTRVPLIFTAHSIPERMARGSSYVADVRASCQGVARLLGAPRWELAWQSRSGPPGAAWLEPDINDVLRARAAQGAEEVAVQAIGFLTDHVEVLYDLDVEARETCREVGIRMHRIPSINAHPEFIGMLGEQVRGIAGRASIQTK